LALELELIVQPFGQPPESFRGLPQAGILGF
jgi:hypothetical protein